LIIQLEIKFNIDDFDKKILAKGYESIESVIVKRFFDGSWDVDLIQGEKVSNKIHIDINEEMKGYGEIFSNINSILDRHQPRMPTIAEHREILNTSKETFVSAIQATPEEIVSSLEIFKSSLFSIPNDPPLKAELDLEVVELENIGNTIAEKLAEDPFQQIYEIIPKPKYIPILPNVTD